jgi:hypothetical protein
MGMIEDLEQLHRRRPFNPFTIYCSAFYVPPAAFLAHKPGSSVFYVLNLNESSGNFINLSNATRLAHEESVERAMT